MKTSFVINAAIIAVLSRDFAGIDTAKTTQACESYLNAMQLVETKAKRGNLRETKKSNDARVTENETNTYAGERNVVSGFLQWHDKVVSGIDKMAKLECDTTIRCIPSEFHSWVRKFVPAKADAKPAKPAKPAKKAEKPAEVNRTNGVPA